MTYWTVTQPDVGDIFPWDGDGDINVDFEPCPEGEPAIDIRKNIEGPDVREVDPFSPVDYPIVVTNTGDVTLENVVVTDPLVPACDLVIGTLEPNESVAYTCTLQPVIPDFDNEACVEGEGAGMTVSDCDTSAVLGMR